MADDSSGPATAPDEVIVTRAANPIASAPTAPVNLLNRSIDRPVDSLWELMTSEPGCSRWLGSDGPPVPGMPFVCPDASQFRGQVGSVEVDENTRSLYLALQGRPKPVRVSVMPRDDGSIVYVEDQLMQLEPDTRSAWKRVLGAIADCHDEVASRVPRQAVVVVHGIGEQRQGETIKDFIAPLLGDQNDEVRSYPQRLGDGSNKWRYRAPASEEFHPDRPSQRMRPETDFYEYYWAHHVGGTTLPQVFAWMVRLLFRWPAKRHTRNVWGSGWLLIAGIVAGVYFQTMVLGFARIWLTLVILLLVGLVAAKFLKGHVGDAARYLGTEPYNVDLRKRIRFEGIDLLDRLHKSRDYDRIVVVGHSLGSVVAYDMLRHYWNDIYDRHGRPAERSTTARAAWFRSVGALRDREDAPGHQDAQRGLWTEQRQNGHHWLVSDFVTLGSPLAHADLLLADDADDFERMQKQLELPTCPPRPLIASEMPDADPPPTPEPDTPEPGNPESEVERSGHERSVKYRGPGGQTTTVSILNHGAVFAPTRWTNVYYSGFLVGDPVGGPVASSFGHGVVDVPVSAGLKPRFWSLAGHARYGRGPARGDVLTALDLGIEAELMALHEVLPVGARLKPPSS